MDPDEPRRRILAFARRPLSPVVALEEDGGLRLVERATGKELRVLPGAVTHVEERTTALRGSPYLLVVFADGRQVALADVGFAFAPDPVNTGPLPDLPETMCFRDFRHLQAGIEQLLAEDGREREALSALQLCIALLDGARRTGFDVGDEERALEALLEKLERRGARP